VGVAEVVVAVQIEAAHSKTTTRLRAYRAFAMLSVQLWPKCPSSTRRGEASFVDKSQGA
jgi:hypothetical protein